MFTLPGYDVHTQLYESKHSRIYRAIRETDACPVILKCLNYDQPSPEQLTRFQREYDLTRRVKTTGVITAYALEFIQRTHIMVLEDIGAEALRHICQRCVLPLPEILTIALNIVGALLPVHAAGLIHKDINPTNIIYNPATGQLKLIDFGMAAQCDRAPSNLGNSQMIEDTLPYLAPEQIGRMQRRLDYRADLYAFGVTFYELLTGQLPFDSEDAVPMVHDHFAAASIPPHQLNPDIPPSLSELVMKLLAKNVDDRYQSAQEVQVDLATCLAQTHPLPLVLSPKERKHYALPSAIFQGERGKRLEPEAIPPLDLLVNLLEHLENARLYTALSEENRLLEERVLERTHALEESNRALEDARKIAETANRSKSAFLAYISHEFRTPLNAILGYTQLLRRDQTLTAKHLDEIAAIHRSGEHLLLLINDLMDVSRIEAHKMELHPTTIPFPLFLKNLVETAQMRVGQKDVCVVTEFAPDLPAMVLADECRLRQILLNLLSNAIKFTDRGSVTLKIKDCQLTNEDGEVGTALHQSSIVNFQFSIEDTGAGILPEHLPYIFDAFYQGDRYVAQEGSGLGLTISQQLVRLMGSELYVKSTIGQGSTFWFDLSLVVVPAETSGQTTLARPLIGYAGERRKIMLVDDNAENRAFLRDLLAPLGFDLQETANGYDALEIARNWQPHVILMDLRMSPMDGFETTQAIRELEVRNSNASTLRGHEGSTPRMNQERTLSAVEGPVSGIQPPDASLQSSMLNRQSSIHPVIIAISANISESVRRESLAAGCNEFLTNPVGITTLLDCLQRHLGLEWIYATTAESDSITPTSKPLMTPPPEVLRRLISLANSGYVNDLEDLLAELAQTHVDYLPFVTAMSNLARNLHLQQVVAEVESYLQKHD